MKKFTFLILVCIGTIITLAQRVPAGRMDLADVVLSNEFPSSANFSGVLALGLPDQTLVFDLQSGNLYTAKPPQRAPELFVDHGYGAAYPVWHPTNPDLAVVSYDKYVSTVNLTEGRWKQISTGVLEGDGKTTRGRQADWSPDGKYIISNDSYYQSQGDMILYDVESTDMIRISVSFGGADVRISDPVWHPDNSIIVFIGYEELELVDDPDPDTDPSGYRIYTIPVGCWEEVTGCTAATLLPGDIGITFGFRYLDFDADGTRLLTIVGRPFDRPNVYLYDTSTETLEQITDIGDEQQVVHSPTFSPDGEAIAFVLTDYSSGDNKDTLVIQDLSGDRPTYRLKKFVESLYEVRGLSWREGTYTYIRPPDV